MKKFKTASGEPPVLHRNSANLMQNMLDEVKADITIIPELKNLIPPLLVTEYDQLKSNILKDGCREPLLIWQTTTGTINLTNENTPLYILIDGHNRHQICRENNVDFKVVLRDFPSVQAVRDFMIDNQLGRRNLTPEQMSYLRGLKYRNERQGAGRPVQDEEGDLEARGEKQSQRTREKLAKAFNVSPRTIMRDREYSEGIDRLEPELKQEILKGSRKLPKEVIREIGRTVSPDTPLLTLSTLVSMSPPFEPTTVPTVVLADRSGVKRLVDQIAQLASMLNPEHPTFIESCDKVIGLLKEAKKNSKSAAH